MSVAPHRIWFIRCNARRRAHPIYRTVRKRWLADAGLRTAEIVSALGKGIMSSWWPDVTRMRARYRNSIKCIQRGELTRNQIADAQRGRTAVTEHHVGDYAEFFSPVLRTLSHVSLSILKFKTIPLNLRATFYLAKKRYERSRIASLFLLI